MKEMNKDLVAASLAPMVLMILQQEESYGYEIIQQLREKSRGRLDIAEGTLYPVLRKMEEKKWVRTTWRKADTGRKRRYYMLTQKGKNQLNRQVTQWNFVNQLMQNLWNPQISNLNTPLMTTSL